MLEGEGGQQGQESMHTRVARSDAAFSQVLISSICCPHPSPLSCSPEASVNFSPESFQQALAGLGVWDCPVYQATGLAGSP